MLLKKLITGTAAIPLVILAALVIIYVLFLPQILKYVIEDQGEKRLGRKVEVGYAFPNIFNGSVNIKNFRIYEPDEQNTFLSFRKFYINFSVPDLFKKVYHIESVGLVDPVIHIVQLDSTFNFSDITNRFSSDTTSRTGPDNQQEAGEPASPFKFIVENLAVTNGTLSYTNRDYELADTVKHLDLHIPIYSYKDPTVDLSFFFDLASGGDFKGICKFNTADQSMILKDTIRNFNLSKYEHYFKPYLDIGSIRGYLHTSNYLKGNTSTFDLSITGKLTLTDFAMTDPSGSLVAGLKKFSVGFDSVSFSNDIMNLDTISLVEPVINIKMTPEGDNFSKLVYYSPQEDSLITVQTAEDDGHSGSNPLEMMESYLQESLNNYLFRNYKINQIQVTEGKIDYDDQTLGEPFHATVDDLNVDLKNLNTEVERSYGSLVARLNEDGLLSARVSLNPRDLLEMELNYEIGSLTVPDFNPYSVYYIAHPFPRGTFNYKGYLRISNRKLNSENVIVIEKINVGDKVKNQTAVSLPVRLAIAVLRDRQGDIRLNIPVQGDLNDPKLRMGRLILDILKNLVIKAATAPYDLLASSFGGKAEDYKELRFDYMSDQVNDKEKRQLENIAAILAEKPELKISFSQVVDRAAELNVLKSMHPASDDNSMILEEQALIQERNKTLARYLEVVLQVPPERFSVSSSDDATLINSEYPYYRIKYDINE